MRRLEVYFPFFTGLHLLDLISLQCLLPFSEDDDMRDAFLVSIGELLS